MDIRGLLAPNSDQDRAAPRSRPPPTLLLPGTQRPPVIDLTGDSPPQTNRNVGRRPRPAEVIDVDSLPDPVPRAPRVETRTLPPPHRYYQTPRQYVHPMMPPVYGHGQLFHHDLERLHHRQLQNLTFQTIRRNASPRTAFQAPGNLEYDRPGPFAKEPRPFHESYRAPSPPNAGFTRSPKPDDVLVCSEPKCDFELGSGDDEVKQRVWISKCGHAYCGECARKILTLAKKRNIKDHALAKCAIPHCQKTLKGQKALIELRY